MKKKITALLLVVALVAVSIAGATMAYFTDTDQAVNVATVGNVKIEQIEQERDANGNLQPYTQGKPAFPAVGPIEWATEGVEVNGVEYKVFSSNLKNVLDKIVTVKNTGKSDAYVRTLVAVEAPDYDPDDLIHLNYNGTDVTSASVTMAEIDGVDYVIFEYVYKEALPAGAHSAPSLVQYFLDSETTNEYAAKFGDEWTILVFSQAVQTAGFDDPQTALDTAFGDITKDNHPWTSLNEEDVDDDSAEDALTGNQTTIIVNLTEDVTYDVAAWANEAMGGEKTELIVINGNGHTITFNQTNSDWNNIVTNGAKLVINNAKITNAGHNDGPWNRHDLNFACEVELNNVTSDKAMAFKAGATLNHVVINDANTSDTYAIWIQPNGQTVTLNNVLIDMMDCTDGRGIKIDEQYVSEPKHVTLNVSNTTFKTEEKSAILVKSVAGATINLDNVDITGVAADPINHVWVDEASAAYADLVTVNGGNKVIEGDQIDPSTIVIIKTAEELFAFANDVNVNGNWYTGKTVILAADIDLEGKPWTPIGQTGAPQFRGTFDGQNHTIKNLVVDNTAYTDEHTSSGLFGWAESGVTIKNVKVDGATVKGNHNVAVIVGYTYSGKIINCHVSNATVTCTHANGDACGDKAGTIAGYTADEAVLDGCTASDSTVTAGRDAGQLFGLAYPTSVSNCSATNVVVSATGDCTKEGNIRNEIIGRVMN